jgi:hypothetical protein
MITLTETPNEGSAILVTVGFKDFDSVDFTPATCKWSLTDTSGGIINSRDRVTATVTSAIHEFILSGDDLLYADDNGKRIFLVEGTYASTYGTLPYREEAYFVCLNTVRDPV